MAIRRWLVIESGKNEPLKLPYSKRIIWELALLSWLLFFLASLLLSKALGGPSIQQPLLIGGLTILVFAVMALVFAVSRDFYNDGYERGHWQGRWDERWASR